MKDAPWLVERLHSLLLACEAVPAASAVFSSIMVCLAVAAPACGPELLQQMQPLMDIVLRKAQLSIQVRPWRTPYLALRDTKLGKHGKMLSTCRIFAVKVSDSC